MTEAPEALQVLQTLGWEVSADGCTLRRKDDLDNTISGVGGSKLPFTDMTLRVHGWVDTGSLGLRGLLR